MTNKKAKGTPQRPPKVKKAKKTKPQEPQNAGVSDSSSTPPKKRKPSGDYCFEITVRVPLENGNVREYTEKFKSGYQMWLYYQRMKPQRKTNKLGNKALKEVNKEFKNKDAVSFGKEEQQEPNVT